MVSVCYLVNVWYFKIIFLSSVLLFVYSGYMFIMSCWFMTNDSRCFVEWVILNLGSCSMKMSIVIDNVSSSFSSIVRLISGFRQVM